MLKVLHKMSCKCQRSDKNGLLKISWPPRLCFHASYPSSNRILGWIIGEFAAPEEMGGVKAVKVIFYSFSLLFSVAALRSEYGLNCLLVLFSLKHVPVQTSCHSWHNTTTIVLYFLVLISIKLGMQTVSLFVANLLLRNTKDQLNELQQHPCYLRMIN